jgi:hypothetical protein
VRSSSAPVRRLNPTISTARIAASFRVSKSEAFAPRAATGRFDISPRPPATSAFYAILPLADQRRTTALVRLRATSGMAGPDERARALWKAPERAEPHAGQALTAFSTGPRSRPSLTRSQTTASEATPSWASFLGDMAKRGGPEPTISSPPAPARTFTNDAGAYLWIEKAEPGQPLSKPGLAAHVWGCARAVLSSRHCEQAVAVRQSQRSMSGGLSLYAAIGRPQRLHMRRCPSNHSAVVFSTSAVSARCLNVPRTHAPCLACRPLDHSTSWLKKYRGGR